MPVQGARILIVDNDPGFTLVLANRFDALQWEHRTVGSAVRPEAIATMRLSALVLDPTVLPAGASWSYLESVACSLPNLGLIVCTGPTSVAQRVRGLRIGTDAWMTKPCNADEVIARIESVLRMLPREQPGLVETSAEVGGIAIRTDLHQAYVGIESADLTGREFEVLVFLRSHLGEVLSREDIYERVWGYGMAAVDRTIDEFIRRLRKKLRVVSPNWRYIHTHYGVGYRFEPVLIGVTERLDDARR